MGIMELIVEVRRERVGDWLIGWMGWKGMGGREGRGKEVYRGKILDMYVDVEG